MKRRIKQNVHDNWYGYEGTRRVIAFGTSSTRTAEQAANDWLLGIDTQNPCMWFAGCLNDATGTTPHPILGDVPTCDRCHKFATS